MQFKYKGFTIDVTPLALNDCFIAQAVIDVEDAANCCASVALPHALRNMRTFDTEREAIPFALYWGVTWIDKNLL